MDWTRFDAMSDAEIAAAVARDPDSAKLAKPGPSSQARQVVLSKFVRMKLAMSREAFAAAYGIPLAKLEAWEKHEAQPTETELAFLRVIEREPERARLVPAAE